ncbi:MAG: type IV toxin-antitoxin system AbiEi family antitoxin domain-containing protein [Microthrixaceae bacterium]
MKALEATRLLEELSASQWGMVTTAQAAAHGVPRLDLSRLCQSGHLERLAHGVYRNAGAPSEEFESLRATWLAADPSHTAEQRLRDLSGGVVVMGASAASLHGVGDLPADRHEFSAACSSPDPDGAGSPTADASSNPPTSRSPTVSR